jgi:hypothetical protein
MATATPLAGPPVPVYPPGDQHVECPVCFAVAWWHRPDGSKLCGHCVEHRGVIQPNTNGEVSWCKVCVAVFWADRERYLARFK